MRTHTHNNLIFWHWLNILLSNFFFDYWGVTQNNRFRLYRWYLHFMARFLCNFALDVYIMKRMTVCACACVCPVSKTANFRTARKNYSILFNHPFVHFWKISRLHKVVICTMLSLSLTRSLSAASWWIIFGWRNCMHKIDAHHLLAENQPAFIRRTRTQMLF